MPEQLESRYKCKTSLSARRFLDQRADPGFRRVIQRGDVPDDWVHVDALFAGRIDCFPEAEGDEVLAYLDVADVLAVFHIERQSPAHDRLQGRRALTDDAVQALAEGPVFRGSCAELGEDGGIAFLGEHAFYPPLIKTEDSGWRDRQLPLFASRCEGRYGAGFLPARSTAHNMPVACACWGGLTCWSSAIAAASHVATPPAERDRWWR